MEQTKFNMKKSGVEDESLTSQINSILKEIDELEAELKHFNSAMESTFQ